MNKFSNVVALLLIFSQLFTVAFAMNINVENSGYNFDTKNFHIEGNTDYANQPIKLEILKRDKSFENFSSEEDLMYIEQIYSGNDKSFSFDVNVQEIGAFSYRVSQLAGGETYSSGFATYTEETVNASISSYINNSSRTTGELNQLIEDFYPSFEIDMTIFKNADADLKTQMLTKINETEYEDETSFKKSVSYNAAVVIILSEENNNSKAKYVQDFEKQLNIADEEYYKEFKELDDLDKANIIGKVSADTPYETIGENLENALVIHKIDNAVWSSVADIMDEHLSCNAKGLLAGISGSAAKEAVTALKIAVNNGAVTKISDMYDYLKNSIPEEDNNRGSGGSRGSGGGSRGSYSVPVTTPPVSDIIVNPAPSEQKYFKDIKDVEWAEPAIEYLYKKGVINGKSENIFAPHDNVTREEFVKMIMLAFGFNSSDANCTFSDVSKDEWYYPYISAAYSMNIVSGQSAIAFGTGSFIKRQDMAQMLYNALLKINNVALTDSEITFVDKDEISDYAKNAVSALFALGCLNGDENGNVMPHKNSTRAEAAKLIYSVVTSVNK